MSEELRKFVADTLLDMMSNSINIREHSVRTVLTNDGLLASIPTARRSAVRMAMATLQRLQVIVDDPDDIRGLMSNGFTSAHAVAQTPRAHFVKGLGKKAVDPEDAEKIWDYSVAISCRNEEIWIEKLRQKNDIPIAFLQASPAQAPASTVDLSSLFADMQPALSGCDDCLSVTSPAAYFVDLLQQLKRAVFTDAKKNSTTLLAVLLQRRPDLGNLKLSCANTKKLIPYVDLVNEVLESVVSNYYVHGTKAATNVWNMDDDDDDNGSDGDDDSTDDVSNEPHNVDYTVYQDVIQPVVFPSTVFPYNQAIDSVRTYLGALGSSRQAVLRAFRSPHRLTTSSKNGDKKMLLKKAKAVLDRAEAAECLGLLHEDYIAITGEAFQTRDYFDAFDNKSTASSDEEYRQKIGWRRVCEYWGYNPPASSTDTKTGDPEMVGEKKGLTCIKTQLLPRSKLSFGELLNLLRTSHFSRRLAIVSGTQQQQQFPETLDDTLKLRCLEAGGTTTKALETNACRDLHAFLLLWRRVGWSLDDTDTAVVMLTGGKTTRLGSAIIDSLAYIKRISELTELLVGDILPLWGTMDTYTKNSIYKRIFLRRHIIAGDAVFQADSQGRYLTSTKLKISLHSLAIQTALGISAPELSSLDSFGNLGNSLNLQSISFIYRVVVFCRMTEIPVVRYPDFLTLFQKNGDIYRNPRTTHVILETWRRFRKWGWDLDNLWWVISGVPDCQGHQSSPFKQEKIVETTARIIEENTKILHTKCIPIAAKSRDPSQITKAEVADVSAALFGADIGSKVEAFVNGKSCETHAKFRRDATI